MDILHLVERLEELLSESRRMPMTTNLLVDEDRVLNIVDQMRHSIPAAIKKANRTEAERDRILAQANEEAERIRELARQEAMEQVNRDSVVIAAQRRADNIIERANRDAEEIRLDSDRYVGQSLAQLEQDLTRSLSVVRNGLGRLEAQYMAEQKAAEAAQNGSDTVPVSEATTD